MLADDPAAVLPIGWALGNHWLARGGIEEGERRIRDLLARTAESASDWRMFVLSVGAYLVDRRGDAATALSWSDEALELAEASDDPLAMVVALNHGGQLRVDRGDQENAIRLLRRSLAELARTHADDALAAEIADGSAWANLSLAEALRWSDQGDASVRDQLYEVRRHFVETGDAEGQVRADRVLVTMPELPIDERERLAREMLSLASTRGDEQLRYEAARATATVSWESGNRERAIAANRSAVRTAMGSGSLTDLGSGLLHAGTFAALAGEVESAARLIGAGQHICGTAPGPYQPLALQAAVKRARERLGAEVYDDLHRIGAALAPEEAMRLVLQPGAA
jgi:tetratricopeptide (TPR) repeat protein